MIPRRFHARSGAAAWLALLALTASRPLHAQQTPADPDEAIAAFSEAGAAKPGHLPAYGYTVEILIEARTTLKTLFRETRIDVRPQTAFLQILSTNQVSATTGTRPVYGMVERDADRIDLSINQLGPPRPTPDRIRVGTYRTVPECMFVLPLHGLVIPDETSAFVRFRFQDADDLLAVAFNAADQISVRDLSRGGRVVATSTNALRIVANEGGVQYTASSIGTWAVRDGDLLWSTEAAMEGRPTALAVREKILLIRGKAPDGQGEHSAYLDARTGGLLYYHRGRMAGRDPVQDLLACAADFEADTSASSAPQDVIRTRAPLVRAFALLGDARAAPFLLDYARRERSATERATALAALARIQGDPSIWNDAQVPIHKRTKDNGFNALFKRVMDEDAFLADVAKWEQAFGLPPSPDPTSSTD